MAEGYHEVVEVWGIKIWTCRALVPPQVLV